MPRRQEAFLNKFPLSVRSRRPRQASRPSHFWQASRGKRKSTELPKSRAKAKAKLNLGELADAKVAEAAGASINAELQAHLARCDAVVKDYFGKDVVYGDPCHGGIPPYDKKQAAAQLGKGESYVASCPLFWINTAYELQPNVPRYRSRIDALQAAFFSQPARPDDPIVVHLNQGEMPHDHIGSLRAMEPPEMRDAFRQAIAAAVEERASKPTLKAWLAVLMSIHIRFEAGGLGFDFDLCWPGSGHQEDRARGDFRHSDPAKGERRHQV